MKKMIPVAAAALAAFAQARSIDVPTGLSVVM